MPIYLPGTVATDNATLEDFPASFGESTGAAFGEAFAGNPASLLYDLGKVNQANTDRIDPTKAYPAAPDRWGGSVPNPGAIVRVQKLPRADAEQRIKDSGVKIDVPDDGYSDEALSLLIDRKQEQRRREDLINRGPQSMAGKSARVLASLGASLVDPLNVASAFVPVVGEARYAQLLARATGALGRAGVRGAVGAAEGAVGAALLEPVNYYAHDQLQDDYTMADSLENIAFGTVLGGGLHAGGGAIADAVRGVARAAPAVDSPVREVIPAEPVQRISDEAFALSSKIDSGKLSVEEFSRVFKDDPALAREVIALRAGDRPTLDAAPFEGVDYRAQAAKELSPNIRAELLADAGNVAPKGEITQLKADLGRITADLEAITKDPAAAFKATAKDLQSQGMSRKKAESQAREQLSTQEADLSAQRDRLQQQIDTNAKAEQAAQSIRELDKGNVPEKFADRIAARAGELEGKQRLIDATALPAESMARFTVANVSPDIRRSALRAGLSQALSGRNIDVESIIRMNANDPESLTRVAETSKKSASNESSLSADYSAADAAGQRLKQAPKSEDYQTAEAAMTKAVDRLNATIKNIELGQKPRLADSAAEHRLREKISKHFAAAVDEYNRLPDAAGGKILNTDLARELSPDYIKDRTLSADVHEPASSFVKKLYAEKLKEKPGDGEAPLVIFTAGGTGAGKTTAIDKLLAIGEAQIVYDTNMNTFKSARDKVVQALDAGKDVQIAAVYRDPVDALVNGALPRAMRQEAKFGTGRTVPIGEHLKTHTGFSGTITRLADEFKDDPRFSVTVIDNSHGKNNARLAGLDLLSTKHDTQLEGELKAALRREYEQGKISKSVYEGFAGESRRAQSADRTIDGGQSQSAHQSAGFSPAQSQEIIRELAAANELVSAAESYGNALRAAALCGIRS